METAVVAVLILFCCVLALLGLVRRRRKGSGDCAGCPWRGTDRCREEHGS